MPSAYKKLPLIRYLLAVISVTVLVIVCFDTHAQQANPLSMPISNLRLPEASTSSPPTHPIPIPHSVTIVSPPLEAHYQANLSSDVFGARLFTGAFANSGATPFNPDYLIATGDTLQIRLWGAFIFDSALTVDPQGNIFLPHVGPVQVRGIRNADLQTRVDAAVRRTFRANVNSYANLAAAQPVRVFVSGNVSRPGLYSGTSMDSLLHYLDKAGGIDTERGSFLTVQVKRGRQIRASFNLYEFLTQGHMPLLQLADGDVIFVPPRQRTIRVSGLAENAKRFEFAVSSTAPELTVASLSVLSKPLPQATHVRVVRNSGILRNTEYYPLAEAGSIALQDGDTIEFTADKQPGTITVRVEGEHQSAQEYVLPYGARLSVLLQRLKYTERSDAASLQLYRQSVKERQKQMLEASLKSLETAALTARSGTSDEARLRKEEAELLLQWVDRAKQVEPKGQVVIAQSDTQGDLLLENGDVLRVPAKDGLVLISGEVLFPNAVAFDPRLGLDDYVKRAGGYTQNADAVRLVIARRDGSFAEASGEKGFFSLGSSDIALSAGDEILVLPKIDVKSRQIWKDMMQVIYQVAVSAKIVLGF